MIVKVDEIKVGKRLRAVDQDKVKELAESISELGLINPITIDLEYNLIAGAHRLEAVKYLGWEEVNCVIKDDDGIKGKLIEIDENLIRAELTALERAEVLAERKRLYEIAYPETKHGGDHKSEKYSENQVAKMATRFSLDTAQKTGISERAIQRDVKLSNDLSLEAKELIKGTPLEDKQSRLIEIAELNPELQVKVVKMIINDPRLMVIEAVRIIEAERYGFKLKNNRVLAIYETLRNIEDTREKIEGVLAGEYPPFDENNLIGACYEQDQIVLELRGELKPEKRKKVEMEESLEKQKSWTAKEIMEMDYEDKSAKEAFIKEEIKSLSMERYKQWERTPIVILPDGEKRIYNHLTGDKFRSGLLLEELLKRLDLPDNEVILIRRVKNIVSVSRSSVNVERFQDEVDRAYKQIDLFHETETFNN